MRAESKDASGPTGEAGGRPAKGFVLAAGLGTRLRPLSLEMPKPAWPFFDVPLAAYALRALASAGVGEVIVNLHHLPGGMRSALEPWCPAGVSIRWSPEDPILGTGGALLPWREVLSDGPFYLLNGDTVQEIDLEDLWRWHRSKEGAATLTLRPARGGQAPIEVDAAGRIVRFLSARAPGTGPGRPCEFTGIHVLEPEILSCLRRGPHCINAQVHTGLVERGVPLYGYVPEGETFWSDLGTPARYLGAHCDFLERGSPPPGSPGTFVMRNTECEGGGRILAPSYRGPGARVARGSTAGPCAVLGAGSRIDGNATVARSVLWPGATVRTDIRDAVVAATGSRLTLEA